MECVISLSSLVDVLTVTHQSMKFRGGWLALLRSEKKGRSCLALREETRKATMSIVVEWMR